MTLHAAQELDSQVVTAIEGLSDDAARTLLAELNGADEPGSLTAQELRNRVMDAYKDGRLEGADIRMAPPG